MLREHRAIVSVIVVAATLVGVAAGIRIAQIQDANQTGQINITLTDGGKVALPENTPARISKNFYKPLAPTTPAKPTPKPSTPVPPVDGITAESYIVGNLDTGDVYLEKNADAVMPFASMSKLITALVATNLYATDTPITISDANASVDGDISGVHAGETFTAGELIYPLLMTSSNIAAEAFASASTSTDRTAFMALMDGYSWEIGMPHAYFADPSGLDSRNAGTARGFLAMAQYLYKSRPDILAITRIATSTFATTTDHGSHVLVNIHPFVSDPRFLGGKTGHTNAALDTMLTILKISGHPVAFIVLRSDDRTKDTDLLIDKLAKEGMKPEITSGQ